MDTTKQVHKNKLNPPNKEGKGGFGEHPENRNNGHWNSRDIFNYQLARFLHMTLKEFEAFGKTPKQDMTMAERTAYYRVAQGKDLAEYKDMADRLQGRPMQSNDVTTNGKDFPIPIFALPTEDE